MNTKKIATMSQRSFLIFLVLFLFYKGVYSQSSRTEVVLELDAPSHYWPYVEFGAFNKDDKIIESIPYNLLYFKNKADSIYVPLSIPDSSATRWIIQVSIKNFMINNPNIHFSFTVYTQVGSLQSLKHVPISTAIKLTNLIKRKISTFPDKATLFLIPMSEWIGKEKYWSSLIESYGLYPGVPSELVRNLRILREKAEYTYPTNTLINYMVYGVKGKLKDNKLMKINPNIPFEEIKLELK